MLGWISLHRQIQEHWIWKSKEPFDKRSAWIDLLLLVNYQTKKVEFDNQIIEVERGQKITSLEKLADRWKWSRHKVSNFLNSLEKDGMLVQIRDKKRTLICIENYNKYQIQSEQKWDENGTPFGIVDGTLLNNHERVGNTELQQMQEQGRDIPRDM